MDWVQLALDETFKAIEEEQERMAGLQDQHEDTGLCTCGVLIPDCDDAYAHITGGAWWRFYLGT